MYRLISAIALAAAIAMPSPATPQSGNAPAGTKPPTETVVVEARRPTEEEARAAISLFVAAHSSLTRKIHQLARWQMPVCPTVANLPKEFGAFIAARIKTLARSVGARTEEPCKPNVTIIYTPEPQATIEWIAKHKPDFLGMHFIPDREMIAAVTRPIQAWYVTATSNGMETFVDNAYHPPPAGTPGSRFANGLRSDIVHVLIVIDSTKLAGHEVGPIGDYVAMLALSQAQAPDDCVRLPSILNYLAPECRPDDRPQAITEADLAYLKGLYAISPALLGFLQRAGIITHMNRSLAEPSGAAAAPETPPQ